MVTPDINKIIKQSLKIGKNIMFYLPRNINIIELFELLFEETKKNILFLDIHVLNSANKIKALLLVFGPSLININISEIEDYLNSCLKRQFTIGRKVICDSNLCQETFFEKVFKYRQENKRISLDELVFSMREELMAKEQPKDRINKVKNKLEARLS